MKEHKKKERLDVLLVKRGLAESREKAKAIIMTGNVFVKEQREDKAGSTFDEDVVIEVKGAPMKYVSRGGYKLEKAMECFPITLEGKICMDVGASTGGFTDCMLMNGAVKVYSVDVGYGQLAWKLRTDDRVVNLERTNFRYVTDEQIKDKIDFKTAFKRILSNRKLNILNLIAMMKTMISSACFILLPFLWKNMGYRPFYIGMALFAFIFAGGIGSLVSSNIEKKIGSANVFYISMISTLPLMILFVLSCRPHPTLSLIIFIIMGFVTMMATPVTMLMAQNVLPEYRSIISGFINGFSWGVVAIAMSMLGFVAENFGITNVLLFVAVIPAICSILVKELFKENN